jgi:hypothetical protein
MLEIAIALIVGFGFGYGVREGVSRRRGHFPPGDSAGSPSNTARQFF